MEPNGSKAREDSIPRARARSSRTVFLDPRKATKTEREAKPGSVTPDGRYR